MNEFKDLGLSDKTLKAIHQKGFEEPTEIQRLTIPLLLENKLDIIAQAQTGTGKTAAFALPLIENIRESGRDVQAIILAPTRELVIQVCEEINALKGENRLVVAPIYGGQSIELQLKKLKRGISVVVGTPGRILDHLKRRSLDLSNIRYFILDEADEMLNMGFIDDIEKILQSTPQEKRVLLFSATMPAPIKKLAEKYMGKYTHVKTKTELTTKLTDQIYFEVSRQDKFEALSRIVDIESDFYGLVFCRTKVEVGEIANKLIERGYAADGLHGDISQSMRESILARFRKKKISILVATDVAARGIDVANLTHVINYSLPQNPESYIHRIGRTGRAGSQGTAITFVTPDEFKNLGFIKRVANVDIRKKEVPNISQIVNAKMKKITDDLRTVLSDNNLEDYREWVAQLTANNSPEDILAAILKYSYGKQLDSRNYRELRPILKNTERKRGRTLVEEEGKTRLFIAKGKNGQTTTAKLLDFITRKTGTPKNLIENIEIYDDFSFITVPFAEAEFILKKFRKIKVGRRSIVMKAKTEGRSRR
ncbi:MAG: DEAD/DEAH box helicase [Calditrichaceae bacterium]